MQASVTWPKHFLTSMYLDAKLTAADLVDSAICALVYMERVMQHANLQSTAKLVAKGDIMALV